MTRDWNFLVEVLGEREETVNVLREIERETSVTVNPGTRFVVNSLVASLGFVPMAVATGTGPRFRSRSQPSSSVV